jgi:class 3 adenylate cyclase
VLSYLVTHPNRLVAKDELLDAVWPETAVSEAVVRIAIGALRKVLGDTAQTPRYIATVSRRGYHFLAPVVECSGVAPGSAEPVPPAALQMATGEPPDTLETSLCVGVAPLPGAIPLLEAERRYITVLFCELVDSTTLAGHLGPEDFREVVRAYHQSCAEVIHRFDGYLAQYLGDGVLVYFGYPMAHEDDAQRAVQTGLSILEALGPLNTRLILPPTDRVALQLGVHTRLVVMGAVGEGARQEPLALGETPNIAARLQRLAAPNTLAIVVVLEGEAGIGKSRLVQVLEDHVAGEARTWLECRGSPYYQHTALYPVTDLFQRWLPWRPGRRSRSSRPSWRRRSSRWPR